MNYNKKKIWITGASSGIGEAMAYGLAQYKPILILSARNEAGLQKVKAKCVQLGAECYVYAFDLTNAEQIKETASTVIEIFGSIDVLVNNGGITQRSGVLETPIDIDRRIMETDYFGHVALTKAVLPQMVRQKSGQIIVISSLSGLFGFPMRSAYCAAKHALLGFFETVRAEHYFDNIKVTIVCPGHVHTNISYHALTASGQPHGKMDPGQLNGIPVEKAAQKIIRASRREKKQYVIAGKETIMVYLKYYLPVLFYWLIPRLKAK